MSRFSVKQLVWGELVLWSQSEGWGPRGNSATCSALPWLSVTSSATHKQIEPFWCWFPGGWACVQTRPLWVSPMSSPVKLGVSLAAATPTGVFTQRFWGFISLRWSPELCGLSVSPVVPPGFSTCECGTACSASHHLAACPLHPGCPSPPLLLVRRNVSLTPWLSEFHTVWLSGSSGCFLFLNLLLCFFWLCEEAVYLPTPLSWPKVTEIF